MSGYGYARQATSTRPVVTFAAPPSLGVLRLVATGSPVRAEGSRGRQPLVGFLGGDQVFPVTAPVTAIGRGLRNAAVLLDPSVSREHAHLITTAEGWQIANVSEHNPLWVGPQTVAPGEYARVMPGDLLRLGETTLQLLAPLPSHAAAQGMRAATDDPALEGEGEAPPFDPLPITGGITALEASSTRLFSPGVTLQFALKGQLRPGAGWALGLAVAALFVLSALLTLGTAALVGQDAFASGGVGHVLAAVTIPLIPVLGVALVVGALDRYEREPLVLLLGAFLWGAVIAIPPVLFLEHGLLMALVESVRGTGVGELLVRAAARAVSAGVVEETIKGAGLLVLLWALRDEFDNVTDGILYGAVIGAGFALVENYVYFALTPRADLGYLIFGRVVLGWLSHSTFTALFGAGLGYVREGHGRRWGWLVPLAGFVAGLLLHTYGDFVVYAADVLANAVPAARSDALLALGALLADYVPLLVAQWVLLRLALAALRREAAVVREYLAAEVPSGVVTPDEYALLQNASLRASAEHRYALTYGLRAYLTARALYQTATGLAFRKWHVALGDPPKATQRQPEDAYRARVARLRRSLLRQMQEHKLRTPGYELARNAPPTQPLGG